MGGFLVALSSFLIFAVSMGALVFALAYLGASAGMGTAGALRLWGRRIQSVSAVLIILVGAALIYSGIFPGIFDELILTK